MNTSLLTFALLAALSVHTAFSCEKCSNYEGPNLKITKTEASYLPQINSFVMEIQVEGKAGETYPIKRGQLDGAPVLGYVFPTSLKSTDVGFGKVEGIVALAVTSHPDFDDTALWDENGDGSYDNDGKVWHTHWVVLQGDERVPGKLSVVQFKPEDKAILPPTNPGMPMYMDSPGYTVVKHGNKIRVVLPADRIRAAEFRFDAVTAFMQVNTSDKEKPMLGVYKAYSVASGDLSLPYSVKK